MSNVFFVCRHNYVVRSNVEHPQEFSIKQKWYDQMLKTYFWFLHHILESLPLFVSSWLLRDHLHLREERVVIAVDKNLCHNSPAELSFERRYKKIRFPLLLPVKILPRKVQNLGFPMPYRMYSYDTYLWSYLQLNCSLLTWRPMTFLFKR